MKTILKISALVIFYLVLSGECKILSQWQSDTRLTNDLAMSKGSYNNGKWVAVNSNSLHVVWNDSRTGVPSIFYKKSTDNGNTWNNEIKINDANSTTSNPVITATGNIVYIAWRDDRNGTGNIYFVKSTDNGNTWGNNIRLVSSQTTIPSIACHDSNIFVAWNSIITGNGEIYYTFSTDYGNSWSNIIRKTNNTPASQFPSVDYSGNTLHMIWLEQYALYELFYAKSTNNGLTWSDSVRLVNGYTWSSSISASGNNIHLAYELRTGSSSWNSYYMQSTDNGTTWNPQQVLSTSNTTEMSVVHASGNVIHYVWNDIGTIGNGVYYRISTDNGNNWAAEINLTTNALQQETPCINVSNSFVHVVWVDNRDGNSEIYYKRNLTGNGPFSVSGLVTYKDNNQPVTGGYVKALVYDPFTTEIITVDSTIINNNGTYTLPHVPGKELDLMYYQDDDYLQFVPTYYVSTIDWRQSTKITPTGNMTNVNCQVYRINNNTNPYTVSGQVTGNLDMPIVKPLKDAIVYVKSGSLFKNFGITDAAGNYTATKLPAGSYEAITYRMGFAPVSQNIVITSSSLSNINFNLGNPIIGIQTISNGTPTQFSLSQNYPNPFNPETKINFSLPVSRNVKLEIFDVLGRSVITLINSELKAGVYSASWNAANMPSGIYFYRLTAENFTETKKMILIK